MGVLLYELLTGQTPFDARELLKEGLAAMRRAICEQEPVRPSTAVKRQSELRILKSGRGDASSALRDRLESLAAALRGDLDWIVMKCLEKDRTRRYATASELAQDLDRHLKHEPVSACPPSTTYRVRKFVRRHQAVVTAGTAVVAALVLGLVVSTWQWVRANRERKRAEVSERAAQTAQRETEAHAYAADMHLAQQALLVDDLAKATVLLDRYRPGTGREHLRGFEWRYLAAQARPEAVALDRSSTRRICDLDLSPNGRTLAVAREGGIIELWDPEALRRRLTLQTNGQSHAVVAFSPQRDLLAATASDGAVQLWRFDPPRVVRELRVSEDERARQLIFSPDGQHLAVFDVERNARIWNVDSGREVRRYHEFQSTTTPWEGAMDFSPDGRHLAVGDRSGRISIIDWVDDRVVTNFLAHGQPISCLAYAPEGRLLASGSVFAPEEIRLWKPATGELAGRLEGHRSWIGDLRFTADGRWLVSGSGDQTIRIWDVASRTLRRTLRGHTDWIMHLVLSRDGSTLFSGGWNGTLARWDLNAADRPGVHIELPQVWRDTRFLGEGTTVVDHGPSYTVWLHDVATTQDSILLEVLGRGNVQLAVAPRSGLLACTRPEGPVRIWSLQTLVLVTNLVPEHTHFPEVSFTLAEDRLILIEGPDEGHGWVHVWDTRTWQKHHRATFEFPPIARLHNYPPVSRILRVSPDGSLLVMGGYPGWITWIDLCDGAVLGETRADLSKIEDLAFSRDGRRLASSHLDGTVALWDVKTRQETARWKAMPVFCTAIAFSPDGDRLATAQGGGPFGVRLWDLRTAPFARELLTLPAEQDRLEHVEFSPDGDCLLVGDPHTPPGRAYVWRLPTLAELDGQETTLFRKPSLLSGDWATKAKSPTRITTPPKSLVRDTAEPAEFRVEVTGEGPWQYQWQHEGVDLPGQTNAVLRLASVLPNQAGEYQVSIRSTLRDDLPPVLSPPASLGVRDANLLFGALRREHYRDIPGLLVSDLTNHAKFPDHPDLTDTVPRLEIVPSGEDVYGTRLTGYLIPPVTGDYTFYVASDNASILFLSTDDDPANKRAIACEQEWSYRREWRPRVRPEPDRMGKVSGRIHLETGRRYYVEVLHKESDVGDHLAVAWQLPGQPPPLVAGPPIQGRYLVCPDVPHLGESK